MEVGVQDPPCCHAGARARVRVCRSMYAQACAPVCLSSVSGFEMND